MQLKLKNGWCVITSGSFTLKIPAEDTAGGDDRIEIRRGDCRLFVEPSGEGLRPTTVEQFV